MTAMFFVFLFSLLTAARAEGFELNQMPIFHDGQWKCEKAVEEYQEDLGLVWGKSRVCRLKRDSSIEGKEVFAFGNPKSFYKCWYKAGEYHQALRVKGKWKSASKAGLYTYVNLSEFLKGKRRGERILANVTFRLSLGNKKISTTVWNPEYLNYLSEVESLPTSQAKE